MGIFDGFASQVPDIDPQETTDWIEAFDQVVQQRGKTRARYLLNRNVYLGATYTYTKRDSSGTAAFGAFSRDLFLVRLGAQL